MAYPSNPAAPASPPRPTTVTVSSYLLWLAAAVSLIGAIMTVSMTGRLTDAYRDIYAGTDAEGAEGFLVGVSVVGAVVAVLFGAGLALLAVFNNRGRNGARITTWVVGGISLCCTGFGLAGTALTSGMNLEGSSSTGGPSPTEVQRRLDAALPSWYEPLSNTLSVVSLLAILGAVILLALPASNAFFRKPAGGWDPSQPYPYPGQTPPYPGQQSGQPPYPGQEQQPPYPQSGPPAAPPSSPGSGADPWGRPPGDDDQKPPAPPA